MHRLTNLGTVTLVGADQASLPFLLEPYSDGTATVGVSGADPTSVSLEGANDLPATEETVWAEVDKITTFPDSLSFKTGEVGAFKLYRLTSVGGSDEEVDLTTVTCRVHRWGD